MRRDARLLWLAAREQCGVERRRRRGRGGGGAIEDVVGVELEDEGGDLDLRPLVAAGEERPGLRELGPTADRPEPVARERAARGEAAAAGPPECQ